MRPWFLPARVSRGLPARAAEATQAQVAASGASLTSLGVDPIDGERGWKPFGKAGREVPEWTREKAVTHSVAAFRINPMARAIIDTYTSFSVGDSGVTYQVSNPDVERVVEEFWTDPKNKVGDLQEAWLRSALIQGEDLTELMVAELSGVVRFCPIDPSHIRSVGLDSGNPLWPKEIEFAPNVLSGGGDRRSVVTFNDATQLREGQLLFWTPFKTLLTDVRSMPFLAPVLDHLDAYDMVIANLIDRTALARYLVWDVTVKGDDDDVANFVKKRGGLHTPTSGAVEVHNDSVTWEPQFAPSGASEDSVAAGSVLTALSAGAGLAKTWLAEPDGANRATSLSMAEPVRRRVRGVQKLWLGYQTELTRFRVDQAVAAKLLAAKVKSLDAKTGKEYEIRASQSVKVTGPEVAAADAEITAKTLLNLGTGLEKFIKAGLMSKEAAAIAARKAWEQFMGVPWRPELSGPDADPDAIAEEVDKADEKAEKSGTGRPPLRAVI